MAPFFKRLFISTFTCSLWAGLMCGVEQDSWTGFSWKGILYPSTSSRISESFVGNIHVLRKYFSLPVRGIFATSFAENKLFIHEWRLSNPFKGIVCGKDILNNSSFSFLLTLYDSSIWLITSKLFFWGRIVATHQKSSSVLLTSHIEMILLNDYPKTIQLPDSLVCCWNMMFHDIFIVLRQ